jgi:hypothetical protein
MSLEKSTDSEIDQGTNSEETPEAEFDFTAEYDLEDGAVAATAKVPGVSAVEIDDYEDFLECDLKMVDDQGNLYGLERDEYIGFISDSEEYENLDEDEKDLVDLHEHQHLDQYSEDRLWGNVRDEEYNLSDEVRSHLNYVDILMDVAEDPILGDLVDENELEVMIEGTTQAVTEKMQENGEELGKGYYRVSKHQVENAIEEAYGKDLEEEFDPDIDADTASGSVTMEDTEPGYGSPKPAA